tara:strand:+ start:6209 stop:7117 length:909 start_codon:yes stop_codon:yes gene_type:complete
MQIKDTGAKKFRPWEELPRDLEKNFPNFARTTGIFTIPSDLEVRDLDWNHMDGLHRPNIHNSYHQSVRLASDINFQYSFTRLGLSPLIMPIFDVKIDDGNFYQSFSIFNLFLIICSIRVEKIDESNCNQVIEWQILSHPWLRFMHKLISKRLYRLSFIQNREDIVIRRRRTELRRWGFTFDTDTPNFLNSNDLSCKIIPPSQPFSSFSIDFNTLLNKEIKQIKVNLIPLYVKRVNNKLFIWPGICPHEGAKLTKNCFVQDKIICPWHNLNLGPSILSSKNPSLDLLGIKINLIGNLIKFSNT